MRINTNNTAAINTTLDAVQHRARARTIDAADLAEAIEEIETKLSQILHKKDWRGLNVWVDIHAQSFPGSYRGIPESTKVVLQRGANDWFLIEATRGRCGSGSPYYPQNLDSKAAELAEFAAANF